MSEMDNASSQPQRRPVITAVDKDDLVIPVIEFGPFLTGTPSDRNAVAASVTNAFKTSGFLYLRDHGIPFSTVSQVFESSARFFARPQVQKDSLGWTSPQSNRGYIKTGQEKLNLPTDTTDKDTAKRVTPDLKETMEIGRDDVDGLPNRWPDNLDDEGKEFKKVMQSFFEKCKALHTEVMRAIAIGMNLPEHYFDNYVDAGDNNLRLLHYPSVPKDTFKQNPGQVRAGEHSDYGSITLLFQDQRGGLQVRSPKGTFVDATPIADTVVVNAGDLLARWSNDIIKSTRHRVVEPPKTVEAGSDDGSDSYPARYSIAYFCNPNMNKFIEALPGTFEEELNESKKYPGITTGDYLVQRLTATI
ncbi:isopenicillin N synthase family dioxygenase [Aspergillus clavatus NRRL 1]|uniref:Oxidoreductase, 2OG-Fe(II) oxygenase family n=1 Tax=Aspergillus clavatus (strain ATCC 1007 / CBS 513.65 / DSM 816 / NCTC 3887 / NRRL 1 / QM 1276 / 107) TaxID=344612 RepID=A1CBJ3_ASPCL|nr:oxidoreductase, 2OG-Fe(II) oxygenase family [Aspergillus clavatus NRRL 1]EAW13111.1 oxidoreductase, 2OG-Fe(II) oxygenase family [Aspergillus clavatus NRRL 1]